MLGDGAACLNQAYCSPWKPINLQTGKPLLDDKFKNLHWPLPLPNNRNDRLGDRSDRLSNSVSDSSVVTCEEASEWDPVLHVLEKFDNYSDLENYIESLPKKMLKPLK